MRAIATAMKQRLMNSVRPTDIRSLVIVPPLPIAGIDNMFTRTERISFLPNWSTTEFFDFAAVSMLPSGKTPSRETRSSPERRLLGWLCGGLLAPHQACNRLRLAGDARVAARDRVVGARLAAYAAVSPARAGLVVVAISLDRRCWSPRGRRRGRGLPEGRRRCERECKCERDGGDHVGAGGRTMVRRLSSRSNPHGRHVLDRSFWGRCTGIARLIARQARVSSGVECGYVNRGVLAHHGTESRLTKHIVRHGNTPRWLRMRPQGLGCRAFSAQFPSSETRHGSERYTDSPPTSAALT
jgi:hypothetical protein